MGTSPSADSSPARPPGSLEIRLHEALTARVAPELCRLVRDGLEGAKGCELWINLEDVKATDVVGLAALRQAWRYAQARGVQVTVLPSPPVFRALLQTGALDELPACKPGGSPARPASLVES
ncbi:MAG: STAS domain-containing protein, partial [Candidatus Limnocylindria bacterium]